MGSAVDPQEVPMGSIPKLMVVAGALVLCGGCATNSEMKHQPSSYRSTLDSEVMKAVELQAVTNGAQVYWINPPRKARKP